MCVFHLMMGTETVPETSCFLNILTRLIAREDFITSCRRESFKSQDRQCMYTETQKRVRETAVVMDSNYYYICWVCICSLNCPAGKPHAQFYIVICGLFSSTMSSHII
jgi:hypothetical protein